MDNELGIDIIQNMDYLKDLKKHLEQELKKTEKVLAMARISRDNSPTAMESHSDESRSRLEREVTMHELKVKEIQEAIKSVPDTRKGSDKVELWSFVEVELPTNKLRVVVVPESIGGTKFEDIQCISDKTPIGSAMMGKEQGEEFSFNDTKGIVLSIN